MGAVVLRQIPHPDTPRPVATDNLSLVWVNDNVVGGASVAIASLDAARSRLPDLDRTVLRTRNHPFPLAVKGDAGDVPSVALERKQRVRVGRFDVIELYGVVAGGGEEALVGGDAEAVDLGVWVLDRARADAREGLPETDRVIVSRCCADISCLSWCCRDSSVCDLPVQRMTDIAAVGVEIEGKRFSTS